METQQANKPGESAVIAGSIDPRPPDLTRELAARDVELGPVIGRGSMSVVYRAFDVRHERALAVKVLGLDPADPVAASRWAREIGAVARLRHPNILPLIDSGITADGTHYFLMPLAEGETLAARLAEGPLPLVDAVRYAREIAEALAFAHAGGLVHRDVKPANILLEGGHAVLADFGIARPIETPVPLDTRQTGAGLVVGTPAYMSPEQLTGGDPADGGADLYSLGVVLYESVTGKLPFEAATMPRLMAERLEGKYKPASLLRAGVPPLLNDIISRALAPDSSNRYDQAESLAADLAEVEHQLSGARHLSPLPFLSAAPGVFIATGLLLVALIVAVIALGRIGGGHLDRNRVAVADFRNQTGDSALVSIGPLASDMLSAGLSTIPGLTVVNSDLVFGAARREVDRRIAAAAERDQGSVLWSLVDSSRAATVVSGSYYRDGNALEVFAEVTDASSGKVLLDLGPLRGSAQHPESVLSSVRDSVVGFTRGLRGASVIPSVARNP